MRKLLFLVSLLFTLQATAQIAWLMQVCQLPFAANESSGLVKAGPNSFWTHNDSGGLTELYETDSSGTLLRTLQLTQCSNVDWEELSRDASGRLYIGDFGNNFNFRQTLSIYRIPDPSTISGNTFAVQDTIRFYYPDQTAFPPPQSQWNYDLESMVVFQDSIYLFTKNRTTPYTGYTRVYVIPNTEGRHAAALRDSLFTGIGTVDNYSITGASIKSDGSRLILMSNLRMWVITDFSLPFISQGVKHDYIFNSVSQKEAVYIDGDTTAWFTDEGVPGVSGYLYRLVNDSLLTSINEKEFKAVEVWPNPFDSSLNIKLNQPVKRLLLMDLQGKIILKMVADKPEQTISTDKLKPGVYLLRIETAKGYRYRKLVKE